MFKEEGMMKKFYAMAIALLALASCSNEDLLNEGIVEEGAIRATIEQGAPTSRLAIDANNALTWQTGDAFALFGEGSTNKFTLKSGNSENTATFTGAVPTSIQGAAFPYTETTTPALSNGTLTMTLPATLDQTTSGVCNLPMWASQVTSNSVSFKHLAGLLKAVLTGIPSDYTQLVVKASNPISGEFTATTSAQEPVLATDANVSDENNTVTVSFSAMTSGQDRSLYIPLPVGTYASIAVSVESTDNNHAPIALATYTNKTVARANVYTAALNYQSINATTPAEVNNALSTTGSSAQLELTGTIDATAQDASAIIIPTEKTSVSLDFTQAPTTSDTAPLKIESNTSAQSGASTQVFNIDMADATSGSETYLDINTPTATVHLNSGTFAKVTAKTATNTLIIGEGVKIGELVLNGGNVKLEGDLELTSSLEIKNGITTTIDLNGYTMSQEKECTESYQMISNKGNLTIKGKGKISFKDTGSGDPSFGWGSYTIRNEGTLVVEDATIEHLGEQNQGSVKHMYCAIFQYSGSTTINDGTISTPTYRSVRLWKGDMTINDGNFEGQVWVQSVDDSAELNINGGTFAPRGVDGSSVFIGNKTESNVVHNVKFNVTGGTFTTKVGFNDQSAIAGGISGGTFSDFSFLKLLAETSSIKIGAEITLNETATIPTGKTVTLDLNGKAISQTSDTPVSMITNNGNLTIKDSSNGSGKIDFTFNGTVNNNVAANVISNRGTLVVEGGEISNAGTGNQIGYAIDNYNGSTLTVNGGKITASGSSYYDGIRLFCGSNETTVTVNKGEISTIWAQNPTTDKATAVNGTVIINGGTVGTIYYENYTTVKVKTDVTATVTPYGTGQDNTTTITEGEYTVYSFVHSDTNE